MPHVSFNGLRVLSLETRRAREVEKLIRTYNGEPVVAPAMREVELESNTACLEFGQRLLDGDFDVIIFLTGLGVTKAMQILETRYARESLLEQLRRREIVARGVKPVAALRELQIPVTASTNEPSTWQEVLTLLDTQYGARLPELRVAVQEYGATNPEFVAELVGRCAEVTRVPVYQWALPLDTEPLRDVVRRLVAGQIDVALFMTAVQVIHLMEIAAELNLQHEVVQALRRTVVVSVGPTTTEQIEHYGITPDFEPSRPRMGILVNEAAQYAPRLLTGKRQATAVDGAGTAEMEMRSPARAGMVRQVAPSPVAMSGFRDGLDVLQTISSHIASADTLHVTLSRIVTLVSMVIPCDSCFLWTLEEDKLLLRASRNPHNAELDHLRLSIGEGVTGWVAAHRETVAISRRASEDQRFSAFVSLPEDKFEAMLCAPVTCANRVVGVLNVQHRQPYEHAEMEKKLLATVGVLVGAEIERARLETENTILTDRLETRKIVDKAKGILQRNHGISEELAYHNMQRESRQRRKPMREIAEAVLLADSLKVNSTPA